ncbi:MAG: phenylalanine--tRNA ligase subunit beta [Candidatus Heimdallarchaeota archaeon]|nr:phenylalanine--tRNA ligase subunit beta [Candidatus Heimdallarchaeota archaeon]
MPVIDLPLKKINKLLGRNLTLEELEEYSLQLGADIDDKREDGIKVEYNPNRPDFCSIPGFARALKGIIGIETGLPNYKLKDSGMSVIVEKSVQKVRPFIKCAIIRNVSLDEEDIADLMNTQETLHWVIGRDRKKVSIGIHDMKSIEQPFKYYGVKANSHPFVPLGENKKMTPQEICTSHPKGIKYAHLVEPNGIVPFLVDKNEGVLSFPPIINGILTLVTEKSTDLFIDATGTDMSAVTNALEILTTSFAEAGCQVETVTVEYPDGKKLVTPESSTTIWSLQPKYVKEILGLDLTTNEIIVNLEKARFGVDKASKNENKITVIVPSFRVDILHEVDLIEDIAISYGYHNFESEIDDIVSFGQQHPVVKFQNQCREIMAGLGFIEVVSFTLVSEDWHYNRMRTSGKPVLLRNPVSSEYNIFRDSLLPSLINILQKNKPYSLPQKIFDVGDISHLDDSCETKASREIFLSGAIIHSKVDFVEIKSNVEAVLKALGVEKYKLESIEHPSFFEGRCAKIMVDNKKVGILGEIHPEVLNNFELENPVAAFELEVERLMK